jgi:flagellar hook-length control protein FliK
MNAQNISLNSSAASTVQSSGKNAGGNGNVSFGQMLVQVISGESTSATAVTPSNASPLLIQLMPEWVSSLGAGTEQTETMDEQSLQALIGKLIEQLESEQEEQFTQDPVVQSILSALHTLLASWMSGGEALPSEHQQPASNSESTLAQMVQLADSNHADDLKTMLQRFAAALGQQPQNAELIRTSAQFQQIIQPLLEKLNLSPATHLSTETAKSGEQLPVSSSDARTVNRFTWSDGAIGRHGISGQASMQESVKVEASAQSRLNVLAAKSMVPYSLVNTEATAQATEGQAAPTSLTENTAAQTITVGDLLRGMSEANQVKAAPKEVNAAFFSREIVEMAIKQMKLSGGNGISEAKITLMPEHLGQVDVKISIQNGQVIAQFLADSVHGKEMIEGQLSQLRAALQSQGLQVDKLEVSQQQTTASGMFQDQRQQQNSGRSFEQNGKRRGELVDGAIDFELSMKSLVDQHELESGSSTFIATA